MAQVMRRLAQGQVDPLYGLFGEETYLIHEYTTMLVERILGDASRDFNFDVCRAENDTLVDALSIARTLPMMARYRVVVFHSVHHLGKADVHQLEQYAEHPSESTAFICSSGESDSNKFPPSLSQKAVMIACQRLQGTQLHEWIVRAVTVRHHRIADAAVQLLVQEQENDLQMFSGEIDKLCTYVGDREEISHADVQELCQASRHLSLFTLSDAIGTRQIPQALEVIERLLQQGEPPLVILGMIIRQLRLLWSVKQLLQQRHDLNRIAKTLGLPQYVCRQLITQSQRFSTARLRQLYGVAVEADLAFKTSNKTPRSILEGMILALCAGN
jgi:DNA polymerase-3 subunit delta